MATYIVEEQPGISDLAIKLVDKGEAVPVAHMFKGGSSDFPFDRRLLAENLVDLLNNQPPRHNIDDIGPNQFYYERLNHGFNLHCRYGCRGVSESGIILAVSEKSSAADLGKDLLDKLTPALMKDICDAIEIKRPDTEPAPAGNKAQQRSPSI